jgi:hypothetical protein
MKPFNLEKALAGETVITRDGRKITEVSYCKDRTTHYPVRAKIEGQYYRKTYTIDGYTYLDKEEDKRDLLMLGEQESETF